MDAIDLAIRQEVQQRIDEPKTTQDPARRRKLFEECHRLTNARRALHEDGATVSRRAG